MGYPPTNKLRVIHLPEIVGGNAAGISLGLQALGFHSETWALTKHPFGYDADRIIARNSQSFFSKELGKIRALSYVFSFDVVFFNFGRSLFSPISSLAPWVYENRPKLLLKLLIRVFNSYQLFMQGIELLLLRILKRTILIQYQGDDARQSDVFEKTYGIDYGNLSEQSFDVRYFNKVKRDQIRKLASIADKVYALNPDLLRVLPSGAEFLPYCNINLDSWKPVPTKSSDTLVFGHAPSHRGVKGSDLIIEAVSELQKKGLKVELLLIENLGNDEAKKVYETVDVMIDQLHIGWYGGLAVELMSLGRPVACFLREADLQLIPSEMKNQIPILRISKETVVSDLQSIAETGNAQINNIGKHSREFVEQFHNQNTVGAMVLSDILAIRSLRVPNPDNRTFPS